MAAGIGSGRKSAILATKLAGGSQNSWHLSTTLPCWTHERLLRKVFNDLLITGGSPDHGADHTRVRLHQACARVLASGQALVHDSPFVTVHIGSGAPFLSETETTAIGFTPQRRPIPQ